MEAEVGDAEYDDDPTVRLLQERAAELTGKEAAIYLVTGTMCNQIAMHILARPGHFVACAQDRTSPASRARRRRCCPG